jgi:predicted ATPase/class 3 adenylate cyclase
MVTGIEAADAPDVRERTILTTDIVGSTALLRRYPNDMMSAMDLHDQILNASIRRHAGDPFRSTGDGVLAIFDRPLDAVMAAIEAQREMRRISWGPTGRLQIRFGIHTGLTRARGDNDFFGPALPTATRLQSAANADQILLSGVTVERIASDLVRTPFQISDLGEHHFKGIEPIRVHQVSTADLPNAFPPIGGKRESASGNLPASLSSFLGRERELDELAQVALESRLLTLIGPGGIGKTRLAIEFARALEATFPDGAWLVDLSALERDSEVWPAVAEALLILPVPGTDPRIQVLERLQRARAILVMDNCEHVLDPVADAVTELGSTCGELFLINTSRRALGVEGEALYEVSSLAQGAEGGGPSPAARLFEERGRLGNRRFQPTADDHAVIERICANLDCIPLAIEIAAAQLRRHSLGSIESGVTKPLDLQASIFRRRSGRHQTLRQTLEWSCELLDPNSRRILQLLSVFSGSFHEEQALAVCAADIKDEPEVLRGIDELVETSLLARDTGRHHLRMLQTVQAFAREMLDQATPLQTVEARHCVVYAARCRQLGQQIATVNEAKAANAIYDEMSNLRAAFERAITRDLKLAAELAAPLFLFNYSHRGAETGHWYERIMARPGADELEQAPMFCAGAAGHAFHDEGDHAKAAAFMERGFAIEAARAPTGQGTSQGWLCHVAGQMAQWSGDVKGCIEQLAAATNQAKAAENTACEVMSLCMASYVMARMGDMEGARELVRQATEIAEPAMQPTLMGYVYYARGGVAKDAARAIDEYQVSAEWAVMAGNHLGSQRVKQLIAELQAANAAPIEALAIHVRYLIDLPSHGATFYTWLTIRSLLLPLSELKADEHLAVLAGALKVSPLKLDRAARNAVDKARERLGEAAFEQAASRGARFDLAEARRYIIDVWRVMSTKLS